MSRLDELLASPDPEAQRPLDAVRGALREELKLPLARSWRGDVLFVVGSCWAIALAAAAALLALGQLQPAHLAARAGVILSLFAIGATTGFAALSPRRRWLRATGLGVAAAGLAGLVLARGGGTPGTAPQWICTVSHLAVGAGPLAFALSVLRKSAVDPLRAVLLGLSVGTTGAAVGELACQQGWAHVAIWHLAAWVGLAVVGALISRHLRPRSFAP